MFPYSQSGDGSLKGGAGGDGGKVYICSLYDERWGNIPPC